MRPAHEVMATFKEQVQGWSSGIADPVRSDNRHHERRTPVQDRRLLDCDDFKARRHFDDDVAIYHKQVDIHVYDCSEEQYERYLDEFTETDTLGWGESYGLPYRILVPRGWRNLWVAGRCNSSDVKVNGAIRDQPACFMLGQAAGTAAVQALRTRRTAVDLDTGELVATLRKRGAALLPGSPPGA